MNQTLYGMSFNCHLLLMSSSITNGWTLGRAIIEENSRHYNSLVCPLAALSSCFISTNFLLLLHDVRHRGGASSTEFWAFPGLSSFCFFLSFFLETNWIKDRTTFVWITRPRSKSVMWSLSKTTFEKILWSKTPSSTNKVSTTLQSTCFVNIWIFREGSLQHILQFFGN